VVLAEEDDSKLPLGGKELPASYIWLSIHWRHIGGLCQEPEAAEESDCEDPLLSLIVFHYG
jgi:hypothetical protein